MRLSQLFEGDVSKDEEPAWCTRSNEGNSVKNLKIIKSSGVNIMEHYLQEYNEPAMRDLLAPKGRSKAIGDELGDYYPDRLSLLVGKNKFNDERSLRFVHSVAGEIVAVLQVIGIVGMGGTIANIYTLPEYRRKGLVKSLYAEAKKYFRNLKFGELASKEGKAFAASITESREGLVRKRTIHRFPWAWVFNGREK